MLPGRAQRSNDGFGQFSPWRWSEQRNDRGWGRRAGSCAECRGPHTCSHNGREPPQPLPSITEGTAPWGHWWCSVTAGTGQGGQSHLGVPPLRPYLLSHCPALLRGTLHTLNPTLVHLVGSRGLTYPITLQAVLSHSPPHLSHWDPQDFCPSSLTWPVPTSQTCPCAAATAPPRNITPQPNDFLISKAARCEMTGRHDATGM